jgi:type II secretory pathway pseudopilin PulG
MVVAIVGIIAAIAMMRLTDLVRSSEIALARDFQRQLKNGAEIYTARMGQPPTRFTDYVTTNDADLERPPTYPQFHTVSVAHLGSTAKGAPPCQIQANAILCNVNDMSGEGFKSIRVRYALNEVTAASAAAAASAGGAATDHTSVAVYIWEKHDRGQGPASLP